MTEPNHGPPSPRLIEDDSFPFEFISSLAERESWRKEIYRPVYHVHKWWAKRLGSVFRGVLLGCLLPEGSDLRGAYYQDRRFGGISVFDPFMGSGTTIGEAHKLGLTALGRDINPVACESVRVALGPLDRGRLKETFDRLARSVGANILELYRAEDDQGRQYDVLYFFWVKTVPCPHCRRAVDLFPSRIIARNADPRRKTEVQVSCPGCGDIFPASQEDRTAKCGRCRSEFNPHQGNANGAQASCPACNRTFKIAEQARRGQGPPGHRLYGKLVVTPEGRKKYLPATPRDLDAYNLCAERLRKEIKAGKIRLPELELADGHNTRQALNYNYRTWRDFFNARQLLALGWLLRAIAKRPDEDVRDAFFTLFSGALEFNNLFASYKGEGTGAVRHMFSHHILKPERAPIEANVWGTPKSSGSFSNLYKSRLMRALDYRESPFEAAIEGHHKRRLPNTRFSGTISPWASPRELPDNAVSLSCGNSAQTGLPDKSVDLVVTDPPFFDNVHYSELADFFFAWQSLYPHGFIQQKTSTRRQSEVQDADAESFSRKLGMVLAECLRVLRDQGLLVFTYHHSRPEGWSSLAAALFDSGFSVVNAHPVKAEMSVAAPKAQAKEPIQIDMIIVCRKRRQDPRKLLEPAKAAEKASLQAVKKAERLLGNGMRLSLNDRRVIVFSQFLAALGPVTSRAEIIGALSECQCRLEEEAARMETRSRSNQRDLAEEKAQMTLPF